MLEQVSIYTENKRGAARGVFSVMTGAGIDVLGLMNSDSGEFGTMRLIVSDADTAVEEFKKAGYLCKKDYVIAVEVEDKTGALEELMMQFERMKVGIGYMYVGFMRESSMPVIILHSEEMDIVERMLEKKGYRVY